jgi:hypothetical protein
MSSVPTAVHALEGELTQIFGTRLQSFVLFGHPVGNAADPGHASAAHGHDTARAHTLVVVDTLSAGDLRACSARVASWHDSGLATPLLLAAHEFDRSLDTFPFEFGAILANHVVVSGRNPFEGLRVNPADLRRACEIEARGHMLHLREAYLETRGRLDALAMLIVGSAPAFAALASSVARIDDVPAADAATAARHVERVLGVTGNPASAIVELAGVHEITSAQAEQLFDPYLDVVERLVKYIDSWKVGRAQ